MEKLYTCEEVANRYVVKKFTVLNWIKEKKLIAIRPGKQYLVKESALQEFEEKMIPQEK